MMGLEIAFWICAAAIVYIFAGYPLLIVVLAKLRPFKPKKDEFTEPVSVVIAACNEGHNLTRKLDSIFASTIASQIHQVIVASDGSTDDTEQVLANYGDSRVRLLPFEERRGKPAVLNDVIPECETELLILTDARQELDQRALEELVRNFADERVGVVSGELMFREEDGTAASQGIGFYWKYEKLIRRNESRFRGVPGATGALYAMRKSLFQPIPPATLLDDVAIPMQAVVQGKRCLFEGAAIAWDRPSKEPKQEAIRKRRTIAGAAQLVAQFPSWLLPWKNPIWFEFVSHKLARLCSPFCLIALGVLNLLLLSSATHTTLYQVMLVLQALGYGAAGLGWVCQKLGRRSRLLGPALMFFTLNFTTLMALWDATRGKFRVTWKRSEAAKLKPEPTQHIANVP